MAALPSPKGSPYAKEAHKIKNHIDEIINKMQKNQKFMPTRENLDEIGEELIDYINDHHSKIASHQSYLKAAIIDLTEVPQMTPQMQHISFLTALQDASYKLKLFLGSIE